VVHRRGGSRAVWGFAAADRLAALGLAAVASEDPIQQAGTAFGLADVGTGIDTAVRIGLHAAAIPLLSAAVGITAAPVGSAAALLRSVQSAEQATTLRAAAGGRIAASHFRCGTARFTALRGAARAAAYSEHPVE